MADLFDLSGRVALLTGASRGMGRVMAEALALHGATVVISSRKQEQLDEAAAWINAACARKGLAPRAHGVAAHAGRKAELEALVEETRKLAGPVDILVGNAGVNVFFGPISEIPDAAYEKTMQVNVQANLWLARLVADDMKARGGGAMMFTSSVGALRPSPTQGVYGMSKLALVHLVRNLALEFGPFGIRANAILPGLVRTEFAKAVWDTPEGEERARSKIPLRRLGEPEDFAGVAVFLASDASNYVTGQEITVCGGTSLWN
ncbi:SDR family oxidoreductase [Martelella lutilitoris]|uniref:SDR family oxidoreductase n=1 Tax=Martelella lutilitoris TaxID=2583532 RepID=A0A5C4JRL0_9HYPH|nr:SDR family oxidoreductase [Martelella lutilitoris]TNB47774.1 SDR family oxidoreductase [Martelella lutilitoris]